ncbi:MAG: acyltransferase family protein [Desulfuromonadaceae bacterium]|nr:acyltransferase family protein [Desulfuromonadaceae bacterium]
MPHKNIGFLKYRPEIDGLRAIAVLSVYIFHLNHKWLPGGFVGVDIFFVISGYLITSILYNACETSQFSLIRFYQRRIARIFPALLTVALFTIVGAMFVYTPQDLASAGANLVAATLSLANMKYMLQGNYFTISPDAQPFLHYWSLSVEEQFYLFFPVFLLLSFRYARSHLKLILAVVGVGSLIACILVTQTKPIWAFYLLPTRAWELCSGCILAVIPFSTTNRHATLISRCVPAVGLFLIGYSLLLLHEGPNFPGWQAVIPVAGAVAIIMPRANSYHGIIDKWLSIPIMVKIGKMSYSLYLWHWPVFSLIDYRFYLLSNEMRLLLKISLSILLTILTVHLIENPSRAFLNRPKNCRLTYAALIAVFALCLPLGFTIRHNNYVNAEFADVVKGGLVFSVEPGISSVVLMGDSNGSMYGKVLKEICSDLGYKLTVISVAAGDPLPSRKIEGDNLWQCSLKVIRKVKPDFLVLANHWSSKLDNDPDRVMVALDKLSPYVGHIIILNQPPTLPSNATRVAIRDGARPPFWESAKTRSLRHKANLFLASLQSAKTSVIDISRYFQSESGEVFYLDEQGRQLFQDSTHLSGYGAEKIRETLEKALNQS